MIMFKAPPAMADNMDTRIAVASATAALVWVLLAATPAVGDDVFVTVVGDDFSFSPETITVDEDDRLIILFRNDGAIEHTFTIDELDVDVVVDPGNASTAEFTVTKAGTYTYYCTVPTHQDLGMEGTLVVKSPAAGPSTPGFEMLAALFALAGIATILRIRRRTA